MKDELTGRIARFWPNLTQSIGAIDPVATIVEQIVDEYEGRREIDRARTGGSQLGEAIRAPP